MTHALIGLGIGALIYIGTVIAQTAEARRNTSRWFDFLTMGAVASFLVVILLAWSYLGSPSGITAKEAIESIFRPSPSGVVSLRPMVGFVGIAFTVFAGAHLAILHLFMRQRRETGS